MQTTRLGLLISGLLLALSACALAPLEGEDVEALVEATSMEIHPGKEGASAADHESSDAPAPAKRRFVTAKDLGLGPGKLVGGPTPDPWEEASPSLDESSGPTPDPWQPAQPDGSDRKGSTPEGSSANGPKN